MILLAGCRFTQGQIDDGPITGDAAPDGASDASNQPIDAPQGCTQAFALITNGTLGHRYQLESIPRSWTEQANACAVENGYLAIPNDATELAAFEALAGGVEVWVGVSDRQTEGAFRDVLNTPYNPSNITIVGNKQADDCATATDGTTLDVNPCLESRPGICECEE